MNGKQVEIYRAVFIKDTKVLWSQAIITIVLLLFPMVLGLIYGLMYQNVLDQNITWHPLSVYLYDETEGSSRFIIENAFHAEKLPFVTLVRTESEGSLRRALDEQTNRVGITIKRVGNATQWYWQNSGDQSLEKNLVYQSLTKVLKEYQWQSDVTNMLGEYSTGFRQELGSLSTSSLVKESAITESRILTTNEYYLISLFVAFGFLLSTEYLRDREQKLVARAFTAGVSKLTLYFSNFVSNFAIILGLIFLYFAIVFGIILRPSIDILHFLFVAALQALAISSYQSLISGVFKTNKAGLGFGMPLLFVMLYLGGSFYPVNQSATLESIANGTPNYQLFKLYESLVIGTPFHEPWRIAVVLGVCALLTTTGWIFFSKEEVI
jgi:ABC-type polysaccharide/polyol phosphate export permease